MAASKLPVSREETQLPSPSSPSSSSAVAALSRQAAAKARSTRDGRIALAVKGRALAADLFASSSLWPLELLDANKNR